MPDSGFWARRLAQPVAVVPAVRPNQPVQQVRPWWAPDASLTPYAVPQHPMYDTGLQPGQAGYVSAIYRTQDVPGNTKAKSAHSTERCPECDSVNYGQVGSQTGPQGQVKALRCFDCGFPVVQSASGNSMPSTNQPGQAVQASRQTGGGGFHGDVIVGRL